MQGIFLLNEIGLITLKVCKNYSLYNKFFREFIFGFSKNVYKPPE